jgi:hypothetical protein
MLPAPRGVVPAAAALLMAFTRVDVGALAGIVDRLQRTPLRRALTA